MAEGISCPQKSALVAALAAHNAILAAWIHGSRVKGTFRPESDLDLALLLKHGPRAPEDWGACAADLSVRLGLEVHLGFLQTERPVFVREVLAHGEQVYCADRYQADLFVATALGIYARFHEDRKVVLKAYHVAP